MEGHLRGYVCEKLFDFTSKKVAAAAKLVERDKFKDHEAISKNYEFIPFAVHSYNYIALHLSTPTIKFEEIDNIYFRHKAH